MAATPKLKLVVAGGNGFLGSRICKAAISRGWSVTSISRSGEPHWPSLYNLQAAPEWSHNVEWHKANILQPEEYSEKLEGASAVVHSMGILLEADYKGVLTGKEPVVSGLKKAFASAGSGSGTSRAKQNSNPLEKDVGSTTTTTATPPKVSSSSQLTYEIMNRDSALLLAHEALKHHVPTLLYISAAAGFPLLPTRYISTKRDAESSLSTLSTQHHPNFRTISFRPAMLYDSTRKISVPLAFATGITSSINGLFGGRLPLLGAAGYKPLKVETVAEAVVQAVGEEGVRGEVEVDGIEALATKAWRAGMV